MLLEETTLHVTEDFNSALTSTPFSSNSFKTYLVVSKQSGIECVVVSYSLRIDVGTLFN